MFPVTPTKGSPHGTLDAMCAIQGTQRHPVLIGSALHLPLRGRLRILAVLLAGLVLSGVGFFFAREAHRRQVEVQFQAAARDRAESVIRGLQNGFDDIAVLRSFFEASDDVTRKDFEDFLSPLLTRHPYIQAFQWLPRVTPQNRAALEAEARKTHPGFTYFHRDAAGRPVEMAPGAAFHAVHFLVPFRGNEAVSYTHLTLPTKRIV